MSNKLLKLATILLCCYLFYGMGYLSGLEYAGYRISYVVRRKYTRDKNVVKYPFPRKVEPIIDVPSEDDNE